MALIASAWLWLKNYFYWDSYLFLREAAVQAEKLELANLPLDTPDSPGFNFSNWFQHTTPSKNVLGRLRQQFGKPFVASTILLLLSTVGMLSQPNLQKDLIAELEEIELSKDSGSIQRGYLYALGLFAVVLLQVVTIHRFWFVTCRQALQVQTALSTAVLHKTMLLSTRARGAYSEGTLLTIFGSDAAKITERYLLSFLPEHLAGICLTATVSIWNLFALLGWAGLVSCALMLLMIPLTALLTKLSRQASKKVQQCRDARGNLVSDALNGMQTLKSYSWLDWYGQKIAAGRAEEIEALRWKQLIGICSEFVGSVFPLLVLAAAFFLYTFVAGGQLNASTAFASLSWIFLLQRPLQGVNSTMASVADARVSLQRLDKLLHEEEEQDWESLPGWKLPIAGVGVSDSQHAQRAAGGGAGGRGSAGAGAAPSPFAIGGEEGGSGAGSAGADDEEEEEVPLFPGLTEGGMSAGTASTGSSDATSASSSSSVLGAAISRHIAEQAVLGVDPSGPVSWTAAVQPAGSGSAAAAGAATKAREGAVIGASQQQRQQVDDAPHIELAVAARSLLQSTSSSSSFGVRSGFSTSAASLSAADDSPLHAAVECISATLGWWVTEKADAAPAPASVSAPGTAAGAAAGHRGSGGAHRGKDKKEGGEKKGSDEPGGDKQKEKQKEKPLVFKPVLKDLSFSCPRGTFTAVVGGTGAGKSSLISGLLLEGARGGGTALVRGTVALSASKPFILNRTFRENVTFLSPYNEARYRKVVAACALEPDIAALDKGDSTLVGSNGVTLSGGQKTRLSLARAVYSNAETVFLDGIVENVDGHTAEHLWKHCIQGLLLKEGKTVILATHALHFLQRRDVHQVIVLREGRIAAIGPRSHPSVDAELRILRSRSNPSQQDGAGAAGGGEAGAEAAVDGLSSLPEGPSLLAHHSSTGSADSAASEQQEDEDAAQQQAGSAAAGAAGGAAGTAGPASPHGDAADTPVSPADAEKTAAAAAAAEKKKQQQLEKELDAGGSKPLQEDKLRDFSRYFKNMGVQFLAAWLLLLVASQCVSMLNTWVLSNWVGGGTAAEAASAAAGNGTDIAGNNSTAAAASSNGTMPVSGSSFFTGRSSAWYASVYSLLNLLLAVIVFLRGATLSVGALTAARRMHDQAMSGILHAPSRYHATAGRGRIYNRMFTDLGSLDDSIRGSIAAASGTILQFLAIMVGIGYGTPWMLLVVAALSVAYFHLGNMYRVSARELRRLRSSAKGPVYGNFSEMVDCLPLIRATGMHAGAAFLRHHLLLMGNYCRAWLTYVTANEAISTWLELASSLIVLSVSLCVVSLCSSGTITAGAAAFTLQFSLQLPHNSMWLVRNLTSLETELVSLERIIEVMDLASEDTAAQQAYEGGKDSSAGGGKEGGSGSAHVTSLASLCSSSSPGLELVQVGGQSNNGLQLQNVWLRYAAPLPWVLRGLTLSIPAGAKVAVVGRTGSGKSSMFSLLLKLYGFSKQPAAAGDEASTAAAPAPAAVTFRDSALELREQGRQGRDTDFAPSTVALRGRPLEGCSCAEARELVVPVLQDGYLFKGTLLENLLGPNFRLALQAAERERERDTGSGSSSAAPGGKKKVDSASLASTLLSTAAGTTTATIAKATALLPAELLEAVHSVLERVCLLQKVRELQDGVFTWLHKGGGEFSDGEKALLCFARALLLLQLRKGELLLSSAAGTQLRLLQKEKQRLPAEERLHLEREKAGLLLCDEISANVSLREDQVLHEILLSLPDTVLSICHRLEFVPRFTLVAVFNAGQCIEMGPPQQLLQDPSSAFSALWKTSRRSHGRREGGREGAVAATAAATTAGAVATAAGAAVLAQAAGGAAPQAAGTGLAAAPK